MWRRASRIGEISRPVAWSCRRSPLPSQKVGVGAHSFGPSSPRNPSNPPTALNPTNPFNLANLEPACEKFATTCALASMKSDVPWPIAA
jgi:hypothetical protein